MHLKLHEFLKITKISPLFVIQCFWEKNGNQCKLKDFKEINNAYS